MKKLLFIIIPFSLLILMSCNNSNETKESEVTDATSSIEEKKKDSSLTKDLTPQELGQSFVIQTQAVLSKNLLKAIQTKGTKHGLSFCSVKAYPLTDSMALVLHANIKRVSDKNRNPKNKANKEELIYITKSKELLAKGENPKPKMTELNSKMVGYYPIITNQMCMQCHGNPNTDVLSETLSEIKKLYPNDKAVGYKINELRGIWVVEIDAK